MIKKLSYIFLIISLQSLTLNSQVISFSTLSGSNDIIIESPVPALMEFGTLSIGSNNQITINLSDAMNAPYIAINAPQEYEITIWVSVLNQLEIENYTPGGGEPMPSIPFDLRFAYSNNNYPVSYSDAVSARASAIEVPSGFNSITLPVSKRASGPPTPPPTPEHDGYVLPKGKVYVFFYGSVGPASGGTNVIAGDYSTTINIQVDFATYD